MSYDGAVIVGCGQTEYHKQARHEVPWYIADAIRRALAHAGIDKREVDGLAVSSFMLPPDNTATVAEQLGMTLSWGYLGAFGGAEHVIGLLRAARAIQHEEAEVVVVVAADAFTVARHMAMMNVFNTGFEYLAPYGMGGTNGLFAMVERRHRYEFGTTREQLGKLAVTQRRNAALNPNALLRTPLTLEEYLTARLIADPLRLYDCVLPCSGGDAVVVTSARRARRLGRRPIRILAGDERTNYRAKDLVMLEGGWAEFSAELFGDAGLGHADIDMLQLYDDYPIMEVIQIEGLGFCRKGQGGPFLEATDISLTGTLPINTGGGQLSCGQCGAGGGAIGLTEAVLQLQGEAGDRQVGGARTALVTGFGMVGFVKGLCQSAVILTND
ncbi:MAG TPA: thiolase family protein [Methylomirabilota bacterium]|nr:thiolase family protein [Methylomirabilota bacterium]